MHYLPRLLQKRTLFNDWWGLFLQCFFALAKKSKSFSVDKTIEYHTKPAIVLNWEMRTLFEKGRNMSVSLNTVS